MRTPSYILIENSVFFSNFDDFFSIATDSLQQNFFFAIYPVSRESWRFGVFFVEYLLKNLFVSQFKVMLYQYPTMLCIR